MAKYSMSVEPVSPIKFAQIREIFEPLKYLDPENYTYVSRYSTTRRITDDVSKKIFHETFNQYTIPETADDLYVTVSKISENRLDILATQFYGYPMYWWVLAMANNIIDPFNLEIGSVVRVPPLRALYETGGVLSNG